METSSRSAIAHEHSEYVTTMEGGMLSRSCTTSAEERKTYGVWLEQEQRQCRSEDDFTTAISKPTWTQVAPQPSCSANALSSSLAEGSSSCMSPAEKCKIQVTNEQFFQELIQKQPPPVPRDWWNHESLSEFENILGSSAFFIDFGGRLEVGKKIAQGGQAEIYEAHFVVKKVLNDHHPENFVLKVFPLEHSEWFQHAWAKESESIYMQYAELREDDTCCFVHNCTLLKDGRFAFLMERYWGDLRKAINVQILKDKTHLRSPFPPSISTNIMFQIARGMRTLHRKGTLHRDLKADNVFVADDIDKWVTKPDTFELFFACHVADFESAEGVMGTRFWRSPEVLGILRSSSKDKYSDPTIWTKKVDVYAYGMTCYEVLSGCIPFQSRAASDYNIGDERPPLPDYVDQEIQELVRKCWDSQPSKRPTFEFICDELKRFGSMKIKYCKTLVEDDIDDEAYRWLHWEFLYIDKGWA